MNGETDLKHRLTSLLCRYDGAMQGRNRERVYHHTDAVRKRLGVLREFSGYEERIDVLHRHFTGDVSACEALAGLQAIDPMLTEDALAGFLHRRHIEFHPCDACNLRCSGCTYGQDTEYAPAPVSFPFSELRQICSLFQPRAITLVGGGEPALYRSDGQRLGDLIERFGSGELGCRPALGLISNGTIWPPGAPTWHRAVKWIRFTLDAACGSSYARLKGRDLWQSVVDNVFRALMETEIPQVGVGYLYHAANIAEAGPAIATFARRLNELCPSELGRFNMQFRPWRPPTGRPSISDRILSPADAEHAAAILFAQIAQDAGLEQFVREHTNIAVNLLCRGARESVWSFSDCYFGLAKLVVRADGSIYPCFRTAAQRDPAFYCGKVGDPPLAIALRALYVFAVSVREHCIAEHDKCLFCVFNNLLEGAVSGRAGDTAAPAAERPAVAEDYFF